MARSFPQIFDLRLLFGPRAKQFARSEDAFQQLLGDALKGMAGPYAHVSPTRGRDGSIDAFLLDAAPLEGPFENLPLPLIVECKTHDDTLKDIERNILGQWGAVKKKLEANASAGWKGLFEPWLEARSYVYCVSAHIQAEQMRSSLTKAIEEFFGALPPDQQPPIESIRVVDWSDLRFWLNSLPQVCDEWLGIELELILDHATYLDRLSGFREYLLPSKLEFVEPALDSSFHPERVLQEIEGANKKQGVLLVGSGGVGKTRTAIEVGTQAVNAGWRVLHVLPDEPGIETENLAEIVLPYSNSRTLLIFDYIDQMQRLDLSSLRRSLIPSANERGIQLRLLANARPGWMTLDHPERDDLFKVIEIRPTEGHKSAVIETMANRIAPLASGILGKREVIRLCGTRAIIALLIARELETRASENWLKDITTATFRSGDLVQWLHRRLQENALSVKHDVVSLVPARPDTAMVAAAAALACAPETRETLILVARSAFENLQWPTAQEDARILVESLVKFGWLEAHGLFDSTAHDVVADEVLEQTIHSDSIVFERELAAVLSCALTIPHGIGCLAIAVRRVLTSVKSEEVASSLAASLEGWLELNARTIGTVLETGQPDLTSYALGAILSGPPWDRTAIKNWDLLVRPWLHAHSTKQEARHLLFKSLRTIQAYDETLVSAALTWLERHGQTFDARFVLQPLLNRCDFGSDTNKVREFALTWLDQYHDRLDAQFVLHSLLDRNDLRGDDANKAREFALRWLDRYHDTFEAGFILPPLLDRREIRGADAAPMVKKAVKWVETFYDTTDAEFVLKRLFRRDDVPPDARIPLLRSAIQRLREGIAEAEATFLLRSCLQYRIEDSAPQKEVVALAITWLGLHPENPDGDYVWNRVLRYPPDRVSDSDWLKVSLHALLWLKRKTITDNGFELTTNSLLMRPQLLEPLNRTYVIRLGIELLGTHLHEQGRRRLVASLERQAQLLSEEDPLKRQINEALRTL